MIKIGDKGLVVDYINFVLGVNSNQFTAETEERLKQFQATYNQKFIDKTNERKYFVNAQTGEVSLSGVNYNPYDSYFKPGDNYYDFNSKLLIYPNGVVDIYTIPALTDTEIEFFDTNKVGQVQQALSNSRYTNYEPLDITMEYNEPTRNAIKNVQKAYGLYQPFIPIIEGKNILPNISEEWEQGKINTTTGILEEDDDYITSKLIPLDSNYSYFIKSFSPNVPIYVYFYNSQNEYITAVAAEANFTNFNDFALWFNSALFKMEGIIPYCQSSSQESKIASIKVSINSYLIVPQDIQQLNIQIERNTSSTSYEPYSLNDYNIYYSGYLNIPTYNIIKKEFDLDEVD